MTDDMSWQAAMKATPAPPELAKRVRILSAYFHSPGFNIKRLRDRDNVLDEIAYIEEELKWETYRSLCLARDKRMFAQSREWVRADAAEAEAELLETLSVAIPRCLGAKLCKHATHKLPTADCPGYPMCPHRMHAAEESDEEYISRLRMIRASMGAELVEGGRV